MVIPNIKKIGDTFIKDGDKYEIIEIRITVYKPPYQEDPERSVLYIGFNYSLNKIATCGEIPAWLRGIKLEDAGC